MTSIEKEIRAARPKLRKVAPLTAGIVILFGLLNLVLGAAFAFDQAAPKNLFIVNDFITLRVWGIAFFLLGIAMIFFYLKNDWPRTRQLLAFGVFVKTFWLFALVFRAVETTQSSNALLLILWAFITGVQVYTFLYFIPVKKPGRIL